MMGVLISFGRAKRSTRLGLPPSTLTSAMPVDLLRAPIHRTDVPVNVKLAVAPAAEDCIAVPPLHPKLALVGVQAPLNVTAASDSSKRPGVLILPPPLLGGVPPLLGGVPPLPGGVAPLVPGLVPGLSPPPPPPQETSVPASHEIPAPPVKRLTDDRPCGWRRVKGPHQHFAPPRRAMSRAARP